MMRVAGCYEMSKHEGSWYYCNLAKGHQGPCWFWYQPFPVPVPQDAARITALRADLAAAKARIAGLDAAQSEAQSVLLNVGKAMGRLSTALEQSQQERDQAREERDKLRAFAQALFDAPYDGGDIDGGELQDLAVKHGLLAVEARTEPCKPADAEGDHPGCHCCQFGFPAECYRKTPLLRGGE